MFTKMMFTNKNKHLFNGNFECYYSKISNEQLKPMSSYDNLNEIFVVPIPLTDIPFVVVDGNHRICSQIQENIINISALYVNYPIAARSLQTPFQICVYCFIEDFQKLKYNLLKYDHLRLKNSLNIFKQDIALDIINERA